ncbi:ergothioneine biosynthesis protein 1 [Colletotrichum spaethianum]|uniref:Ergothioneine biosynthesis protein 1 n=1 Tax=Colletotrichum spaethianum TaxID=700344 RepID=A0AA37NYT8_9PEZI|nr:ergothioneine biosynthesis protein 1 [Colletotrichum spaethianum]GKT46567.1 ergothioneine biosynthesis protein 1 [Colletotrichum spaethianum]
MTPRLKAVVPGHGSVLDIGGGQMSSTILNDLRRVFVTAERPNARGGLPTMPDELLYDDKGLAIWADIIFTPQFYQTRDEIALFERHSGEMARHYIPDDGTMIDLGAGDMRKVNYLLEELAHQGRKATYLALDISKHSLTSNLEDLAPGHAGGSVHMAGLWGDFTAGLAYAETLEGTPRVFLSLGSVLFNDPWKKAVASLRDWAALMRPADLILAGMDGHDVTSAKVWDAYHSHPALFESFFHNGLRHANALLGEDVFRPGDWDICAEIESDEKRHRFYLRAKRDVVSATQGKTLRRGLEIDWFDAHKRSDKDVGKMCTEAGLEVVKSWAIDGSEMRQYLLRISSDAAAETSSDEKDSAISVSGE